MTGKWYSNAFGFGMGELGIKFSKLVCKNRHCL